MGSFNTGCGACVINGISLLFTSFDPLSLLVLANVRYLYISRRENLER
jgi:hypothetical protein